MPPYRLTNEKMKLIVKNWQLISDKYNGNFRNILSTSPAIINPIETEIRRFEMTIPYGDAVMIFRTSENHHFKVEIKFQNKLDFEVQIYPEDFVEKISKLFGMKEIEIGNSEFDGKYIIKSNKPEIVLELLDSTIQKYMIRFKLYSFQLSSDDSSTLIILPFIREQEFNELEEFIAFSGHLINRLTELNKNRF